MFIAESSAVTMPSQKMYYSAQQPVHTELTRPPGFKLLPPKAADQNITVEVLSDDYGTGSVPWGKFHSVAVISCQRSLQKIPSWQGVFS